MDWIAGEYRMRMPSDYVKPASCFDQYYSFSVVNSPNRRFSLQEEVIAGTGNVDDIDMEECRGSFNYDYVVKNLTEFRNCSDFPKLQLNLPTPDATTPDCSGVDFTARCRDGTILGCYHRTSQWASQIYDMCAFSQTYEGTDGKIETTWDKCRLEGAEGFSYNIYQCQDRDGHLGVCANNCKGVNPNSIIIGGFAPIAVAGLAGQGFLQAGFLGAAGLGAVGVGAVGMGAMGGGLSVTGQCPNTRPCRVREQMLAPLYGLQC